MMKKIAAIHDLSGYGRASLTVAIPILSYMGYQVCPLPTAVLSAHSEYEGFRSFDLTEQMQPIIDHWKQLGLRFDALYSGYLASERQLDIVEGFFKDFTPEAGFILVDPVLGDRGRLYPGMEERMVEGMRRLCSMANVITPNLTEAALLLDCPYDALPTGEAGCREIVERLSLEGRRSVVLTGASGEPGTTGAVCFDAATGRTGTVLTERVPREFHGTGDVFASVLTGALVQGADLFAAARRAVEFVRVCGERTAAQDLPMREGVDFEPLLGLLVPQDGREPPLPHTGM